MTKARGDGARIDDPRLPRPRSPGASEAPRASPSALAVAELFCGLGGCAEALRQLAPGRHRVVAAVDVNHRALAVYRHNFPHHPVLRRSIESLGAAGLAALGADLWWLSPPCQPFTRRGLRRDDEDPRARPLLALIEAIRELRPSALALENVPGFDASRCRDRLLAALDGAGYETRERLLCPSELGWPNRRRRYYLVASRKGLAPIPAGNRGTVSCAPRPTLASLLAAVEREPLAGELAVDPGLAERYRPALSRVRRDDPAAITACFTAAYGRSPVRSGSYLELEDGRLRRFSPHEVLRLLGFGPAYRLPPEQPVALGWRLAGNSLSIPAVAEVLRSFPQLAGPARQGSPSAGC